MTFIVNEKSKQMETRSWSIFQQFGRYHHPPPQCPCRSQLSPSLSAPGPATQKPAEERKQRNDTALEGGKNGWMDEWMKVGGGSPQGLWRKCLYQSLDGRRMLF